METITTVQIGKQTVTIVEGTVLKPTAERSETLCTKFTSKGYCENKKEGESSHCAKHIKGKKY